MDQQHAPSLFSTNIKTKGKVYFFDVRSAKNGNKYIAITESSMNKEGKKFRSTLTVFQDQVQNFEKALQEMASKVRA